MVWGVKNWLSLMKGLSFHTPIGNIWLLSDDLGLRGLLLPGEQLPPGVEFVDEIRGDKILEEGVNLVRRWERGESLSWGFPLDPQGTEFQLRVWRRLMDVPFGSIITYGELAKRVAESPSPISPRAVGAALARNPIPILIPCHRVVKSDGSLGGYSGGIEFKELLLQYERALR